MFLGFAPPRALATYLKEKGKFIKYAALRGRGVRLGMGVLSKCRRSVLGSDDDDESNTNPHAVPVIYS